MTIPDHITDKAAQAIITSATPGITLAKMHPEDRANVRLDARAALEAVAADIWEQGYAACSHNRWLDESVYATGDEEEQNNPYIQETN